MSPKGAKTVTYRHLLALPVDRVHEVLTSERYLLTLDGMDPAVAETNRIVSARSERLDSGTVQAVVVMHPIPAEPEEGWESEEARSRAFAEAAHNEVAQVTRVTGLRDGACTMTAVLPLANGIGEVLSSFEFRALADFGADDASGMQDGEQRRGVFAVDAATESPEVAVAGSEVRTEVLASLSIAVKVPAVRAQFEQALLARAAETVLNGVRRIEALS